MKFLRAVGNVRRPPKTRFSSLLTAALLLVAFFIASTVLNFPLSSHEAFAQSPPPPIWPTIQHDFQRTSDANAPGPSSNSTDWLYGPTGSIQGSPVIGSDGTIYVVDSNFHLYAISPDGSVKWESSLNEGLASPAIGPSGTIYVAGTRHLYAFYPNGDPAWTVPYNLSTSRNAALAISPQGILFEIDSNGTLYAINPFGTVATTIWTYAASCVPSSLAIGPSGSLYCGTNLNGTGAALDSISANGQLQWTYPTGSIVSLAPTIASDGTLFVINGGGEVFALSSSGAIYWTIRDIHAEVTSAVLGPSDTIYVAGDMLDASGNFAPVITQIYQSSPTPVWSEFCYTTNSSLCYPFGAVTSMAVDSDGILYVGTNTSGLIALNPFGGLVWAYTALPMSEGSLSPIAIGDNGTLYVGTGCLFCNVTTYGHLIAIGQPPGYYSFNVGESGLPAGNSWSFIVNGENFSTSGTTLVFSLPNGSYSWTTPPSLVPNTLGVRYAASVLEGSFSVPSNESVTLSFSIEYQLNITASPGVGGNVSPAAGLWYTPGTIVQLNATASPEYDFGVWSTSFGQVTALNQSVAETTIQMNGPGSIFGIFDPLVNVTAGNGGSVLFLDPPYVGTLQSGQSTSFYAPSESVLVLTARPSSGYSFSSWNESSDLGIDASSSVLQFKIATPGSLTAEFTNSSFQTSTSLPTTSHTTVSLSTSITTTARAVTIPSTSVLPTRNVALDVAAAFLVVLLVALGVILVLGLGLVKRKIS